MSEVKVTRIRNDNIESMLMEEPLLLVACMKEIHSQQNTLKEITAAAIVLGPSLKVCYVLDDLLPYFEKRFHIMGTPTFLLIRQGKILDSLLGKNAAKDLLAWVRTHMKHLDKHKGKENS